MNEKNILIERIKKETLRKDGFTLAETLTTLLVIGVISAIVYPPLKANLAAKRFESADKKFQSTIKNALGKMTVKDELRAYSSTEDFVEGLKEQISISKVCPSDNLKGCFPDKFKVPNETKKNSLDKIKDSTYLGKSWKPASSVVGLVFPDGVSALVSYDTSGCSSLGGDQQAQVESCIAMAYDLDGINNTNAYTGTNGTSDIGTYNADLGYVYDCGNFSASNGNEYTLRLNRSVYGTKNAYGTVTMSFNGYDANSETCTAKLSNITTCLSICANGQMQAPQASGSVLTCYCNSASSDGGGECLVAGTMITLADGSQKKIEDLTFEDEILVWNFDEGKFDSARALWLMKKCIAGEYNLLTFSDGRQLKTIRQHRIFNKEAGKYTYTMTDDTPIGTTTFLADGSEVTLVDKKVIYERVEFYNVMTEYHFNCFAEGISTSNRFNNLYPIKDYKFVKDNRELVPYSEYKEIPYEWYLKLRLAEQPREVNRDGADLYGRDMIQHIQNLYIGTNKAPVVHIDLVHA